MEIQKTVTLGYNAFTWLPHADASTLRSMKDEFLLFKLNPHGRILLCLKRYLEFTKIFDRIDIDMIFEADKIFVNGSVSGLIGKINRSEADVGVTPIVMNDESTGKVDFCYPFKFGDLSFVTRKPNYVPQIL